MFTFWFSLKLLSFYRQFLLYELLLGHSQVANYIYIYYCIYLHFLQIPAYCQFLSPTHGLLNNENHSSYKRLDLITILINQTCGHFCLCFRSLRSFSSPVSINLFLAVKLSKLFKCEAISLLNISPITLVLLVWKWMGLFLRKIDLLRCWGWLSLLNWMGALMLSLLLKLPLRKLEPWFILWSFFLLRLLCISINLPYGPAWNTVVMSELVLLVATYNCWISYKNGYCIVTERSTQENIWRIS